MPSFLNGAVGLQVFIILYLYLSITYTFSFVLTACRLKVQVTILYFLEILRVRCITQFRIFQISESQFHLERSTYYIYKPTPGLSKVASIIKHILDFCSKVYKYSHQVGVKLLVLFLTLQFSELLKIRNCGYMTVDLSRIKSTVKCIKIMTKSCSTDEVNLSFLSCKKWKWDNNIPPCRAVVWTKHNL